MIISQRNVYILFSIFQKDQKIANRVFEKITCGASGTSDGLLNLGKPKKITVTTEISQKLLEPTTDFESV